MADINAAQAGVIKIGDLTVNRIGLGTNRITDVPEARDLLKKAVELGVNFVDTAYRYTNGASETTIGNTLAPYPDGLVIATKGGWTETKPEEFRHLLEESLRRLHTDHIDLYQLHRVNPDVSFEETIGMLKQFQDEGKIRQIGLSEVSVEQLQEARKIAPIVSVQNEYNVAVRKHEALVDYCTDNNIVFIPWFPLGGLRGDTAKVDKLVAEAARKHDATSQQIALAWLLKRSPMILPIPGTLSIEHLKENLKAGTLDLSDEDYRNLTEH
jgi:pyridoxine 4-dehydrogenase